MERSACPWYYGMKAQKAQDIRISENSFYSQIDIIFRKRLIIIAQCEKSQKSIE